MFKVFKNKHEQPPTSETDLPKTTQRQGFFSRLKQGLSKTRESLTSGLSRLILGKKEIDEALLEEIETLLITADVGVAATTEIIQHLTQAVKRQVLKDPQALIGVLQEQLQGILIPCSQPLEIDATQKPTVILMVGINGSGKTTTIGKLAKRLKSEGKSVMLAAGDTFRAAAVEQLQVWGERNQIPVVSQQQGADTASVIYDAYQSAKAKSYDVLIADTAGRLHTQSHLMEELKKVKRVIQKLDPSAPHEVMLVLDATLGQNALVQAEQFHQAVHVTGITLTKLDGTAKGGIIFALAKSLQIPIRYIGVGETIEDLRPFEAKDFVDALFSKPEEGSEL